MRDIERRGQALSGLDSPAPLFVVVGPLLLGIVCGEAAKLADESQVCWAADPGTYPARWVLVLAVIGRLAPTMGWAAARAAAFFLAMSLAYVGWSWLVLGFVVDRYLVLWLGLAITAAVVRWACVHGGRSQLSP